MATTLKLTATANRIQANMIVMKKNSAHFPAVERGLAFGLPVAAVNIWTFRVASGVLALSTVVMAAEAV